MDSEKTKINVHIRWMIRRDMPQILATEKSCFIYPWVEEEFLAHLRDRNCIGMVAELGDKIAGYMVYLNYKNHHELLKLVVNPFCWNSYVGTQMIDKIKSKLNDHRRTGLNMVVRETNLPAQLFLQKNGFQATEVLREFFEDSGEDGYSMWYTLNHRRKS
jgi:ribosomal-protein-alanine N-acetyltransferase